MTASNTSAALILCAAGFLGFLAAGSDLILMVFDFFVFGCDDSAGGEPTADGENEVSRGPFSFNFGRFAGGGVSSAI